MNDTQKAISNFRNLLNQRIRDYDELSKDITLSGYKRDDAGQIRDELKYIERGFQNKIVLPLDKS